jgi:hypothetical protein
LPAKGYSLANGARDLRAAAPNGRLIAGKSSGGGIMAGKWSVAASILLLLLVMAPLPVRAADPAFCRQYARAALAEVRGALASPRCGAGLQGARWSAEFSAQYEWCLGASRGAAAAERDGRTRYLKGCTDR